MFRCAALVCLIIGPAFAAGLPPWAVAAAAALVLTVATAWRAPHHLKHLNLPWLMAPAFAALTIVVAAAHDAGLLNPLLNLAGTGTTTPDLLRVAGTSALTSNAVNNLPAYLALEPAAADDRLRLMAVLIGTNAGPLVTPWASLATLLWLQRCRAAGVRWRLWRLALGGLVCGSLAVLGSTLAVTLQFLGAR